MNLVFLEIFTSFFLTLEQVCKTLLFPNITIFLIIRNPTRHGQSFVKTSFCKKSTFAVFQYKNLNENLCQNFELIKG